MGIFISVQKTVECVLCAVIFAAGFCAAAYKALGILQALGYKNGRLFKWARKKGNQALNRQILLAISCALGYAVVAVCFCFAGEWAAIAGLAPCILFFAVYLYADRRALRSPAAFTPRFKRLYAVFAVVSAVIIYLCITLLNFADYVWENEYFTVVRYLPLAIFPLLTLPVVALSNSIACIYELPKNRSYIKKAKEKLERSEITVVGVTGSFGKTSVKQILSHLLSGTKRTLATPSSHNTPLGIAMTVNGAELSEYDVFIAEMGARRVGDIAELCEICPPEYSIITGICNQHLESFGSEENIVKAKGEILSNCKKAVIAGECFGLYEGYPCEKVKGEEPEDIVCAPDGTYFYLTLGGEQVRCHTKLLGRHSANNIALAATAASLLGVDKREIIERIESLDFVEHRLQLIKANGVDILDDGYNSNVKGAADAIEVLRTFGGEKICVTPGLVELGILEESENYALGKQLVGLDRVILVGETLIAPVKKGYLENGGERERLSLAATLKEAQELLKGFIKAGDCVLFLNDLPDVYM